ncbi:hypothetical protein PUR29_36715 [Methylobacterium ajmalii]|uniref:Uncharacterized protein n=1 Tax=Methylobacterium ajmalii TaxID=2738439 RepID=A0ABV0A578_9HYPH
MSGSSKQVSSDPSASDVAYARTVHEDHLKQVLALLPLLGVFGAEALKSAVLINGGTAAALLTFVGQKGLATQPELGLSLRTFAIGLLLGAVATGFAYVAQFCYTTGGYHYIKTFTHPYIKFPPAHRRWNIAGIICHCISVILIIASYLFAVYGFYSAGQKLPF